jgi:hypothetical protein
MIALFGQRKVELVGGVAGQIITIIALVEQRDIILIAAVTFAISSSPRAVVIVTILILPG